ncbi:hypothetical protein [Paractinoplanes lichenicola]|uniref:hypothetical protein n=1 Tax=Paractinoplanes lichenicola TaxID=2802976 RepID=UPI0034DAE99E
MYAAPEPDWDDVRAVLHYLSARHAQTGRMDEFHAVWNRYPTPDEDERLAPGDPDYPATDDDL